MFIPFNAVANALTCVQFAVANRTVIQRLSFQQNCGPEIELR